jgi:hypothetical protein
MGIPPVLTLELVELPELPVGLFDPEIELIPFPLLELGVVCPADAPVDVEDTVIEPDEGVAPGATPAVIVTGTAPASVPKFEYETVVKPPAAPVARIEPLQTPWSVVILHPAVTSWKA